MADTPIFHHYARSPFSEKIRLIFGAKGIDWSSVMIPNMMPKPDVIALTGGYRKTPIMQIGADVYCDTALIARVLDAREPSVPLYPAQAPLAPVLAQWADSTLFWTVIPYTLQPHVMATVFAGAPPEAIKAFAADRAGFSAGMRRPTGADAGAQLPTYLTRLENQLAAGGPFLFGAAPTIADFSVAHCLWFIQLAPPVAGILQPYSRLLDWLERVKGFGHGRFQPMTSEQALRVSATATRHAVTDFTAEAGFVLNAPVEVSAVDYGVDPVAGELVGLSGEEIVVRRRDARAGTVHVHFPRIGFLLKAAS